VRRLGSEKLSILSGRVDASEVSGMVHALASLIVGCNNEVQRDEMVSMGRKQCTVFLLMLEF
jgi:hypothetical protein